MKTAASTIALMGHQAGKTDELVGTAGVAQIAKDQLGAKETKAKLRQSAKAATNALVSLGQQQLVLNHLQPRWLRGLVTQLLDAGEEVGFDLLDQLREAGAEAVHKRLEFRL